jgi:hypothetical protein
MGMGMGTKRGDGSISKRLIGYRDPAEATGAPGAVVAGTCSVVDTGRRNSIQASSTKSTGAYINEAVGYHDG